MKKSYAVITGASSGIGEEFARQLAEEGHSLILIARRKERLEKLKSELEKNGTESIVMITDLSKPEECNRLLEKLEPYRISIFINNAGFGECGSFLETEEKKELDMIDVNIKAMHLLFKRILKHMEKQKYGYILNVASSAGLLPAGPYMAAYYATKSYVASLTRAVARELKERGSHVYAGALCPGPVDTEFNQTAHVSFALPGITPEYCVKYAIRQMKKRKVVIIPTALLKIAAIGGRFIPQKLLIAITGRQQKKKIQEVK